MSYVEVKNKKGTSDDNPPSGYTSWLNYWEEEKGKEATTCEVRGCDGDPDVGGHVINVFRLIQLLQHPVGILNVTLINLMTLIKKHVYL